MRQNCSPVIVENFFEPCLLFLLREQSSYGYELIRNLKEKCGCQVNTGNLYRCLSRLVKNNNVIKIKTASKIGPDRLMYKITPKGKKLLQEWITALDEQNKKISKLIKNYKKTV